MHSHSLDHANRHLIAGGVLLGLGAVIALPVGFTRDRARVQLRP